MSDSLWPHGLSPARLLHPGDFPGKNTGVDCHFLFQGIFLTQGSNPGFPYCRQTLYHLSHQIPPGPLANSKNNNWTTPIHWELWLDVVIQSLSPVQPHGLQHTRPPCPSLSPGVCPRFMSIESVMPFNHLILCHPFLWLSIFPSIRVSSSESALHIRWPKYWSIIFSISPSNEYLGFISFRIDWFDLFEVQGTLRSLPHHHNLKASSLQHSAFFMVQLSHPYMTTGKTIALTMDVCQYKWKIDV